jgi:hypothetical protein
MSQNIRRFSSHSFHDGAFIKVYFLADCQVFAGIFALLGAGYVAFV